MKRSLQHDVSVLAGCLLALITAVSAPAAKSPNILLIMVDDLGFADFGCYGSEIATPRVDALAERGLRFSQFYNTAKCHSSRVCLLSGLYCNQAGGANLDRATTLATVLGRAGYVTSMTGKWHLSMQPTDVGFERYWGHLSGATDCFAGDGSFRLNGEAWNEFSDDFYTTDANVDYAIRFIDEALTTPKPFFHYLAFNAPHYPLQAPKADIRTYADRYEEGWESIRDARFAKQKQLGLFPDQMALPPLPGHVPAWNELSAQRRQFESFRMAIFAAMVDRVDQNIGRLVDHLEARGQLDDTLIMLCSDNGACPFERSRNLDIPPWEARSHYTYDASWALVGNTPFRHYKQTQYEGGISSPLIVHWPDQILNAGGWEHDPGHLVDIMATCIDVAGATYPSGDETEPLQGKSLLPLFGGHPRNGHPELYFQFSSCRALRKGDWKVVSFYGDQWELYNLAEDRCEQSDLADRYPEMTRAMADRWHVLATGTDRLPPKQSQPVRDRPAAHEKDSWHRAPVADGWRMPSFD